MRVGSVTGISGFLHHFRPKEFRWGTRLDEYAYVIRPRRCGCCRIVGNSGAGGDLPPGLQLALVCDALSLKILLATDDKGEIVVRPQPLLARQMCRLELA